MSETEKIIADLQMQNQQLQTIMIQKQTLVLQNREIEKALEELETSGEDVYKQVGPILVKSTKEELKKELGEKKEENDLKVNMMAKQEEKVKEKMIEGQEKIRSLHKPPHGG